MPEYEIIVVVNAPDLSDAVSRFLYNEDSEPDKSIVSIVGGKCGP